MLERSPHIHRQRKRQTPRNSRAPQTPSEKCQEAARQEAEELEEAPAERERELNVLLNRVKEFKVLDCTMN